MPARILYLSAPSPHWVSPTLLPHNLPLLLLQFLAVVAYSLPLLVHSCSVPFIDSLVHSTNSYVKTAQRRHDRADIDTAARFKSITDVPSLLKSAGLLVANLVEVVERYFCAVTVFFENLANIWREAPFMRFLSLLAFPLSSRHILCGFRLFLPPDLDFFLPLSLSLSLLLLLSTLCESVL